jgi:hypothetical protein
MTPGDRPLLEQLRDTLDFAVSRIPWYRERSDRYGIPIASGADLDRLPIIDRATVQADPARFASSGEWPSAVQYSSSTTGGIGQPRWRSAAEAAALLDHLGPPDPDEGVTLAIHPYDQGAPSMPGAAVNRVYAGMLVPWHFDLIHSILADGWRSTAGTRQVTAIDCFSPGLRILTEWFDQRGIDPRSFGITDLYGYGSIQPAPWRRRLAEAWGAHYHDIYAMSDVILSDADECRLCHAYHFLFPVVPEVVDLDTRTQVSHGSGALLLTELHPFAQLQLHVRYWTDDLVELRRACPYGDLALRLLGRRSQSAVVQRPERPALVVGSLRVAEACAAVPDVAPAPITWASWAADVGAPRFSLGAWGDVVTVVVELRYRPALFPARAAGVADEIGTAITAEVGDVRLRVETVGPGELDAPTKV